MNEILQNFFDAIAHKKPSYTKSLNKPCKEPLFLQIEELMGETLPESFKAFYRITDGEKPLYKKGISMALGRRFLSLEEIMVEYTDALKMFSNQEDYVLNDFSTSFNGDKVQSVSFHRKWLPIITDDCGGNYFSLDFAPEEKGFKGQVILNSTSGDDAIWYDFASSFDEFLMLMTNLLNSNQMYFDKDIGKFDLAIVYSQINQTTFPISERQQEIFQNLYPEWKTYLKNILYCKPFTIENLQEVLGCNLSEVLCYDITSLLLCPRLKNLTLLYPIENQVHLLPKLSQLTSLDIKNISQDDLEIISSISSLRSLKIESNQIHDWTILSKLKKLHQLTIITSNLSNIEILKSLSECQHITVNIL